MDVSEAAVSEPCLLEAQCTPQLPTPADSEAFPSRPQETQMSFHTCVCTPRRSSDSNLYLKLFFKW